MSSHLFLVHGYLFSFFLTNQSYTVGWDLAPYYQDHNWQESTINVFGTMVAVNMLAVPPTMDSIKMSSILKNRVLVKKNGPYLLKEYAEYIARRLRWQKWWKRKGTVMMSEGAEKGVEKEKEVEEEEEEEEEESKFEAAWIATLQTGNRTHCRR